MIPTSFRRLQHRFDAPPVGRVTRRLADCRSTVSSTAGRCLVRRLGHSRHPGSVATVAGQHQQRQRRTNAVLSATRRTRQPVHWRCTSERTLCRVAVDSAERLSHDLGCFKVTWEPTLEKSRSRVRIASEHSPIGPTYERTCRRTMMSSSTIAMYVDARSHACRSYSNTATARAQLSPTPETKRPALDMRRNRKTRNRFRQNQPDVLQSIWREM